MKRNPNINLTAEQLRDALIYDPATGNFVSRKDSSNRPAGTPCGSRCKGGYLIISVQGGRWFAHRLAWLYMTGKWPNDQIDHINGLRADNRFENLRDVDRFGNTQNLHKAKNRSKTGLLGVSPHQGRWRAMIHTRGKTTHIGMFSDQAAAHAAYIEAKRRLHPAGML